MPHPRLFRLNLETLPDCQPDYSTADFAVSMPVRSAHMGAKACIARGGFDGVANQPHFASNPYGIFR
jgi:hypothetical protein